MSRMVHSRRARTRGQVRTRRAARARRRLDPELADLRQRHNHAMRALGHPGWVHQ